jgi:transcriptional regulator with XRE-family HTH domain
MQAPRMTINSRSVGERVKSVRGELSQEAFAKLLNISRNSLIRYESGERVPDAELLVKLNVLYNVQPLWLLTGAYEALPEGLDKNETFVIETLRNLDDAGRQGVYLVFERLAGHPVVQSNKSRRKKGEM